MDLQLYEKKLKQETFWKAFLKSVQWTGILGMLGALFWWLLGLSNSWIILLLCLSCFGICFSIYYTRYRITLRDVASRIDELGLQERVITALELEGDDSYIAQRQREDTLKSLQSVDAKAVKIRFSLISLLVAITLGFCALGASAVPVLAEMGKIPTLSQLVQKEESVPHYKVEFSASKGGSIWGESSQIVYEGEQALAVMAVADYNYRFVQWSDGNTNPYRVVEPRSHLKLQAYFAEVEIYDPDNDKDNNPYPDDLPLPGKKEKDDNGTPNPNPNPSTDGNGRYDENNKYLDGEHNYQDDLGDATNDAKDSTNNNKNLTDRDKDIIDGYFDGIKN